MKLFPFIIETLVETHYFFHLIGGKIFLLFKLQWELFLIWENIHY